MDIREEIAVMLLSYEFCCTDTVARLNWSLYANDALQKKEWFDKADYILNRPLGQYTVGQVLEFASRLKEGEKLAILSSGKESIQQVVEVL